MPRTAFDEVADELYALRPSEFTSARDVRASEAKADGDAETARQVKALRKPTVAAWLANQLVRANRDEVNPLIELGAALREATATLSGPQLRQLSRQRNEVVQALVRKARRLAVDAGQPVSEDAARALEGTLNAALADDEAAQLLLEGRLTEPLQHVGFGPTGPGSSTGPGGRPRKPEPAPAGTPKQSAADRRAEQRERLEHDLAEAWAAARAAADTRTAAEEAATAAEREASGLRRRVEQARADLEAAEQALQRATAASDDASTTRDSARSEAERATRRVSALQRELDALSPRSKTPVSRRS
jgi:hypothetical protein